jgi:hypothetical protein
MTSSPGAQASDKRLSKPAIIVYRMPAIDAVVLLTGPRH